MKNDYIPISDLLKRRKMKNDDLLICDCEDVEHMIVFRWDDLDEFVYMNIHLSPLPLLDRIMNAVKYVFGHRSRYGDFDEFIFKKDDLPKLERIVEHLRKQR